MKEKSGKKDLERGKKEIDCLLKWGHGEITLDEMKKTLEAEG